MSAGDESARQNVGVPAPSRPGDAIRNPAQVSFWLLEPAADAAMTYFYAQLFAMDTEIRAMFPAAMDVQRRRFFQALMTCTRCRRWKWPTRGCRSSASSTTTWPKKPENQ